MLQVQLQHGAIMADTERLQQVLGPGAAVPETPTALLGQAHIQRALGVLGMPDNARQQLAQEARQNLTNARAHASSATERLLHEQVDLSEASGAILSSWSFCS